LSYTNLPSEVILSAIEAELTRQKVNAIEIQGNVLRFENALFNKQGRQQLMASVDKGFFQVELNKQQLVYNYSTILMMWITLAMSLFFALVSQKLILGLVCFCWLFGMNWVITLVRNRYFMKKLIKKIIPEHNTAHHDNRPAQRKA